MDKIALESEVFFSARGNYAEDRQLSISHSTKLYPDYKPGLVISV